MVHRARPRVGQRGPQHDPGRRRRRDDAGPQGPRVRAGGRRSGPDRRRPRGLGRAAEAAGQDRRRGPDPLAAHRGHRPGRHGGDHDRCPPPLPDAGRWLAPVPGDERQRLGHQEQVRQHLRLPPLAGRRHHARDRRHALGQGRGRLRLRRRRQGLRSVPEGAGRAGADHRDRPDLRPAGGHGGLPGRPPRGRPRDRRRVRHHDRQQGHHHGRPHGAHEAQRHRRQHRGTSTTRSTWPAWRR